MLLLFWARVEGEIGIDAAVLALSAPPATLVADEAGVGVILDATACVLTLTAPAPFLDRILDAQACTLTLTAPDAGASSTGTVLLNALANVLTLSSGVAGIGIDLTVTVILINGIARTAQIRPGSLTVTDNLDEAPNLATFICHGFTPQAGHEIIISVGTLTNREFAGHLTSVEQVYEGQRPGNVAYHCEAVDYTRLLDRRLVHQRVPAQSVTTTVLQVLSGYTSGFTSTNVATGLPAIAELDFVWEPVSRVLTRLAQLIGAYWYVDYFRGVHFFISETVDAPDPIVGPDAQVHTIARATDTTQVRTQVYVGGQGTRTTVEAAAGAGGNLVVDDATPFSVSGGLARSDGFQFSYASKFDGGTLTTLQGAPAPTAAPTATIVAGVGGVLGVTWYRVSFKSAAGETLAGPPSNSVTGEAFARPDSSSFTATPTPGLGRLIGFYRYALTYVTARGETDAGAVVPSVTLVAWPVPGYAFLSLGGFGPLSGVYGYKTTFLTAAGETTAGPANAITTGLTPSAPTVNEVPSTIGPLIGTYTYRVSFASALGETLPGSASAITLSAQVPSAPSGSSSGVGPIIGNYAYRVSFVSPLGESLGPSSGTGTVVARTASAPSVSGDGTGTEIAYAIRYVHPVYGLSALSARTIDTNKGTTPVVTVINLPAGCGWNVYSTGTVSAGTGGSAPLFKVAEMGPGTSSFTHRNETGPAEGGVTATLGDSILVTNIATGPAGTTARRLYRTKGGGSTYYFVGQLNDNTTTSLLDAMPDGALSVPAPVTNDNGKRVNVSVPTGNTGVTLRRVYRTKAGGSSYYLVGTVEGNGSATFLDAIPDDALTVPAPTLATGGHSVVVSVPTGPTGTIARRLYRTVSGGSTYRFLVELADNTTPTFTDQSADSLLSGDTEPALSTAGGQDVQLAGIPMGPSGVVRRVYRTKAGGAGDFRLVGDVDAGASTLLDSKLDSELGESAPLVNTAGASAVQVSNIPIGPAGTTARRLYRQEAGADLYVAEIPDNVTTTFLDTDDDLGSPAPTTSTVGAQAGADTLLLASAAGFFSGVPFSGWAWAGSMPIHYAGISGNTLTGIPSSGIGAIVTPLRAGTEILAAPLLINVTASPYLLPDGSPVQLLVIRENAAAQAAMAALEGGDGVHQVFIDDDLLTIAAATTRGDAELAQFATPEHRVSFAARDPKLRSGKTVSINVTGPPAVLGGEPMTIVGNFKIQQVVITQWGIPNLLPLRTVIASSVLYSFEHLLRRVELGA